MDADGVEVALAARGVDAFQERVVVAGQPAEHDRRFRFGALDRRIRRLQQLHVARRVGRAGPPARFVLLVPDFVRRHAAAEALRDRREHRGVVLAGSPAARVRRGSPSPTAGCRRRRAGISCRRDMRGRPVRRRRASSGRTMLRAGSITFQGRNMRTQWVPSCCAWRAWPASGPGMLKPGFSGLGGRGAQEARRRGGQRARQCATPGRRRRLRPGLLRSEHLRHIGGATHGGGNTGLGSTDRRVGGLRDGDGVAGSGERWTQVAAGSAAGYRRRAIRTRKTAKSFPPSRRSEPTAILDLEDQLVVATQELVNGLHRVPSRIVEHDIAAGPHQRDVVAQVGGDVRRVVVAVEWSRSRVVPRR